MNVLVRAKSKWLCLIALPVLLTGCQNSIKTDYHKLDLGEVSGTITLDGQPLSNVHVMFQSPENADFSTGTTDVNGNYTMMFNSEKEGVLAGRQIVRIRKKRFSERDYTQFRNAILYEDEPDASSSPETSGNEEEEAGDFESVNPPAEQSEESGELPANYHIESQIQVVVKNQDQVFDFDLKSDGSTTGPK